MMKIIGQHYHQTNERRKYMEMIVTVVIASIIMIAIEKLMPKKDYVEDGEKEDEQSNNEKSEEYFNE
jgi:hypothetical protein